MAKNRAQNELFGEKWGGFEDESEINLNEYREVTMENVQQPVEGESMDALGKFVRKGKQNLY